MKQFCLMLSVIVLTLGLGLQEAQAKRMGGGKSVGKQSNVTQRQAEPARQPGAQQAAPAANPAAAQPQRNRWLGPVAGLAAGLGLAALASHFGFGEELASMMLMALIGIIIFAVIGFIMRRRMQPALNPQGPAGQFERRAMTDVEQPMQYQGGAPVAADEQLDEAAFVEHAKRYFTRLQAAYDKADYDALREFTTAEMFTALYAEIQERQGKANQTDILQLNAVFLGLEKFGGEYTASVKFGGLVREDKEAPATAINEVWHFSKPVKGDAGWVLAGIQQAE
ncbi:Tim44 domain-containing protein [Parvibium lacunae]|uniref:Tim44 domain-containing protein n=1 Tax=Parvibium lacunae TaxID=1888893 RepID=A0A368L4Y9_9BURK|nr:Tim44-like domain-containing protein [Parvibium lacunae]RCS58644.1 Tim44 domain-containing protein [Parvibium lacunae]